MSSFEPAVIDVEDFLECLEIEVASITGDEILFHCPFPGHSNGDATASAQMNTETTAFRCYGCKERGNAISFTAHVLGISPLEAIRMLRQRYQPGGLNPDAVSMVEAVDKIINAAPVTESPQPQLDEEILDRFATDWHAVQAARDDGEEIPPAFSYMQRRGFGPDVLTDWEFGYDPISDRITIPVRDQHSTLIGFKARAHDDRQPKYLILGDKPERPARYGWPCYFPTRVVFGAHRVSTLWYESAEEIVICEGELNAIAVASRTGRAAIAINGSYFSEFHARMIREIADRVILFLDDDDAGKRAVWGWTDSKGKRKSGIVERLQPFIPVLIAPPSDQDAADMDGPEIQEILDKSASALVRTLENRNRNLLRS